MRSEGLRDEDLLLEVDVARVRVHVRGASVWEFGVLDQSRVQWFETLDLAGSVPVNQDEGAAVEVGVGDDALPEIEGGQAEEGRPTNQTAERVFDPFLFFAVHAVDVNVQGGDRLGDLLDASRDDGDLKGRLRGDPPEAVGVPEDLGEPGRGQVFPISSALEIGFSARGEESPDSVDPCHRRKSRPAVLAWSCLRERSEEALFT